MADYKSILKGTLNSVTKKAKAYVESGGLKEAYDKGSTTARCYANIAKLTLQINGELEEQNKVFIEIGRLCYDENRDNPGERYAPLLMSSGQWTSALKNARGARSSQGGGRGRKNGGEYAEFYDVEDDNHE